MANHVDVGYECWKKGYRFKDSGMEQLLEITLSSNGVKNVDFDKLFTCLFAYNKDWFIDEVEEEKKYYAENEPKIREMFHKYFEGKTWEEIKADSFLLNMWDSYSDYHKDVYGYRPHTIVCGEYVNPHI